MAETIRTFTDVRVERYWTLLCILQDRERYPLGAPAFEWLAEALAVEKAAQDAAEKKAAAEAAKAAEAAAE